MGTCLVLRKVIGVGVGDDMKGPGTKEEGLRAWHNGPNKFTYFEIRYKFCNKTQVVFVSECSL